MYTRADIPVKRMYIQGGEKGDDEGEELAERRDERHPARRVNPRCVFTRAVRGPPYGFYGGVRAHLSRCYRLIFRAITRTRARERSHDIIIAEPRVFPRRGGNARKSSGIRGEEEEEEDGTRYRRGRDV